MANFRRNFLIIQHDTGLVVNHRIRFLTEVPYPEPEGPVTAKDFTKYATARLEAWYARQKTVEELGLEEDVFGFFHVPGYRKFTLNEYIHGPQGVLGPGNVRFGDQNYQVVASAETVAQYSSNVNVGSDPFHRGSYDSMSNLSISTTDNANEGPDEGYDVMSSQGNSQVAVADGSRTQVVKFGTQIVSEENPEFAELAKSLAEYRKTWGPRYSTVPAHGHDAPFRPSRMVQEEEAGAVVPSLNDNQHQYLGDRRSKSYTAQIPGLSEDLNCCLWLTKLPPRTSEIDLLRCIREGAVFAVHINPPTSDHVFAAAKLVFMKHSAAAAFLAKVNSAEGVNLCNHKIQAIYNFHGYQDYARQDKSRVLRIRGPSKYMNQDFWENYFKACAKYQISHSRTLPSDRLGENILEVGFARLDGQAETMYHAIIKEKLFRGIFWVEYGPDPCDPEGRDWEAARAALRQARQVQM